ncbi:MAG: hypothetical protein KAX13_11480, partial [Candidatus Krumholzibacteria bacterium]|nr:hypothetical protein [Candidatus Krumholzibacteria bacterium]
MRIFTAYSVILLGLLLLGESDLARAEDTRNEANTLQEHALRVFLDGFGDTQYLKEEIPFVNYVRDSRQAQVHLIYTSLSTGARSTERTVTLIGRYEFEGLNDTLSCVTRSDDTKDYRRSEIVRIIKLGLMRYVSRTPQSEGIEVTYTGPVEPTIVTDRWDYWDFGMSVSGSYGGQESYKDMSFSGGVSADRVTEALKLNFGFSSYYSEDKYDYGDLDYKDISKSNDFRALAVKSINDHWSIGAYGSSSQSLYYNIDQSYELAPAVEYNIFPYSESTHREFRIFYRIGYKHNQYDEETIYFETEEDLFHHSLSIRYDTKARWGSIRASLEGSSYLHDFDLN